MLKTKHRLPAKGQIILEERCDGKREIGDRGTGGTLVNVVEIQSGLTKTCAHKVYPEDL